MLKQYYRWRYSRKEKRPAYTFHSRDHEQFGPAFGHYLSMHAAHQDASDPMERRKRLRLAFKVLLFLVAAAFSVWLIREALFVIKLF